MKISQNIFDKKQEKYRISMKIAEISNKISNIEMNFTVFTLFTQRQKEFYLSQKDELDQAFQLFIQEESFNGKNNTTNSKGKNTVSALSKEFLTVQNEYEKQLRDIDLKINELEDKCKSERSKYLLILKDNKGIFNSMEKDIKKYKQIFNNHIQDQRIYYLEILKMGIDVR